MHMSGVNRELIYREMVALADRHWWFRTHYRSLFHFVRGFLGNGGRLLDVGCGPGGASRPYGSGWRKVRLDYDFSALSCYLMERGERVQARTGAIPLASDSFDFVICSDTLHQASVKDVREAVAEMARVCRPGGKILLSEPAFRCLFGPHDDVEGGCRRFTCASLAGLGEGLPLKVVRSTYIHLTAFFPALLVRRVQRLPRIGRKFRNTSRTDLTISNNLVNATWTLLGRLEGRLLRWMVFPLGTTAVVLWEKTR